MPQHRQQERVAGEWPETLVAFKNEQGFAQAAISIHPAHLIDHQTYVPKARLEEVEREASNAELDAERLGEELTLDRHNYRIQKERADKLQAILNQLVGDEAVEAVVQALRGGSRVVDALRAALKAAEEQVEAGVASDERAHAKRLGDLQPDGDCPDASGLDAGIRRRDHGSSPLVDQVEAGEGGG